MSSFLDGVLKPGQGAEIAVKRELESRRSRWTQPGYHYRGVGDFLLQHGTFWTGREIPEQYTHLTGQPGTCYATALAAAEADPSLRYCEGVYSIVGEHFKGHAWCLDPDGGVVELVQPTDPETVRRAKSSVTKLPFLPVERWGYFGCAFPTAYVRAHRAYIEARWNEVNLFDLSAVEGQDQWRRFGIVPSSSVGWGDNDLDEGGDTDWDDDDATEIPPPDPREYPVFRQPFDPNRTTL